MPALPALPARPALLVAATRFAASPRTLRALVFGVWAVVALWVTLPLPVNGDETAYVRSATELAQLVRDLFLRQTVGAFDEMQVIQRGWFMPGTAVVLTPARLVSDATSWLRIFSLCVNLGLLWAIAGHILRRFGGRAHGAFLAALLLSPAPMLFAASMWSDSFAVLLAILSVLHVSWWLQRGALSARPWRSSLLLGLVATILVLLRANYLAILVLFAGAVLLLGPWDRRDAPRRALAAAGMLAVVVALVAPWSLRVSHHFGPTATITTMPLTQIVLHGDLAYRQMVWDEMGTRNDFLALQPYVARRAKASNRTFMAQAALEMDLAITNGSPSAKAMNIGRNIGAFYAVADPTDFVHRFANLRCTVEDCLPPVAVGLLGAWATIGWWIALAIGIVGMALPLAPAPATGHLAPYFLKGLVGLLAVHPFIAHAHQRYLHQFFPIVAVAVALAAAGVVRLWRPGRPAPRANRSEVLAVAAAQIASTALVLASVTLALAAATMVGE